MFITTLLVLILVLIVVRIMQAMSEREPSQAATPANAASKGQSRQAVLVATVLIFVVIDIVGFVVVHPLRHG